MRAVVISGTGYSKIGRRLDVPLGLLALEAAKKALDEAGMTTDQLDGMANFPHAGHEAPGLVDGVDYVGIKYLAAMLGARRLRWYGSVQPGSFVASIIAGVHAIQSGACEVVLVWRGMRNPRRKYAGLSGRTAAGELEFLAPYGFGDQLSRFAMPYSRYMGKYGAKREHMASFIVNNRLNASLNPDAVFYKLPVTFDDYMSARVVADPFNLLDCDMPVDGAGAVVLTTAANAKGAIHPPAHISGSAVLGINYGNRGLTVLEDLEDSASLFASALWESSPFGVKDVDSANLYDGFSFFTYLALEALGFCGRGEAFEFVQDGRIAVGGELPLNTSGGSLGMGRIHGPAQVIESVRQIQGRCGPRQIAKADVILATTGQPHFSLGGLILSRSEVLSRTESA